MTPYFGFQHVDLGDTSVQSILVIYYTSKVYCQLNLSMYLNSLILLQLIDKIYISPGQWIFRRCGMCYLQSIQKMVLNPVAHLFSLWRLAHHSFQMAKMHETRD